MKHDSNSTDTLAAAWDNAASQDTPVQRAKEGLLRFGRGFTRHYRHLPNKPEFAEVNQQFRKFEAAPKASMETIVRVLRQITDGMTENDLDLFTRKIVLDDLAYEGYSSTSLLLMATIATSCLM